MKKLFLPLLALVFASCSTDELPTETNQDTQVVQIDWDSNTIDPKATININTTENGINKDLPKQVFSDKTIYLTLRKGDYVFIRIEGGSYNYKDDFCTFKITDSNKTLLREEMAKESSGLGAFYTQE